MSSMEVLRIGSFDGQVVWLNNKTELFEVGNFLGGGAAGTVYECEHVQSHNRFALKILNPLGYKIVSPSLLRRCSVYTKGKVFNDTSLGTPEKITKEHIWWVVNESAKQYVACNYSQKQNTLKELSLGQCMDLWGTNFTPEYERMEKLLNQNSMTLPTIPPKYLEFLRKRNQIFREIRNMRKISNHRNVIKLEAVLELIQESKATIFLVMELANGGELFDRIKLDCGTREETARIFFRQLVEGVKHCHDQGVCHRDLKPENLLLQDDGVNGTILKIADFGFSAHFFLQNDDEHNHNNSNTMQFSTPNNNNNHYHGNGLSEESPLRILKSIVGSPFYVAPEIIQQSSGYDGSKADIWSMGVILYAMLAGNLPFGQELNTCKRFRHFCKWIRELPSSISTTSSHGMIPFWCNPNIEYPPWLFPAKFTPSTKGLIVSMLHPDPHLRITMREVMKHTLCDGIVCDDKIPSVTSSSSSSSLIPCSSLEMNMRNQVVLPTTTTTTTILQTPSPHHLPPTTTTTPASTTSTTMEEERSNTTTPLDNTDQNSSSGSGMKSRSNSHLLADYAADEITMFQMEEDDDSHVATTNKTVFGFGIANDASSNTNSATQEKEKEIIANSSNNVQKKLNFNQVASTTTTTTTTTTVTTTTPIEDMMMMIDESSQEERKSLSSSLPPILPPHLSNTTTVRDLIPSSTSHEEDEEPITPHQSSSVTSITSPFSRSNTNNSNNTDSSTTRTSHMPAFHDMVKRSTRFTTTVPAEEVLLKVATILNEMRIQKLETPAGYINRIDLNWEQFRLEIYGIDYPHTTLCALQIYQIPTSGQQNGEYHPFGSPNGTNYLQFQSPPSSWYSSSIPNTSSSFIPPLQQLLVVEFVRGQLEIFAFKRFYQWVRVKLSELVKRDYAMSFFDQASSPAPTMSYFPHTNNNNLQMSSSMGIPIGQASQ